MAANLKSGGGIASLGKRLLNRTSTRTPSLFISTSSPTRSPHASAYDKNLDDQAHAAVVPDDVIQPQSDKYWAPDPRTGVFGPATEQLNASAGGEKGIHSSGANSVLEEKAWFRPTSIEDLEKPHHH
ncbi:hydrogen peroxide induced protein 1 [Gossypium australe]|uniref:Hydrogen peroxide induced protein 1 n=1 Tax=Gossypium australe TaxID=47621 RepID=A0A5B6UKA1_9ROSI|nr:hydrogen peroxide induced protein 1 [Gossypium australe]